MTRKVPAPSTSKVPKTVWLSRLDDDIRAGDIGIYLSDEASPISTLTCFGSLTRRLLERESIPPANNSIEVHWPSLKPVKPKQPTRKGKT